MQGRNHHEFNVGELVLPLRVSLCDQYLCQYLSGVVFLLRCTTKKNPDATVGMISLERDVSAFGFL